MTPRQQLEKWMAKYDPAIAAQAKKALAKMRKLAPGTNELVYDNYNALVIGFAPGERASAAMLSIALYPKYLSLFFLHGRDLPDPAKRLQGNGKQVRWIRLESEHTLDEPEVRELVKVALHQASVTMDPKRKRRMEIRAAVKKPRPRSAPKK